MTTPSMMLAAARGCESTRISPIWWSAGEISQIPSNPAKRIRLNERYFPTWRMVTNDASLSISPVAGSCREVRPPAS